MTTKISRAHHARAALILTAALTLIVVVVVGKGGLARESAQQKQQQQHQNHPPQELAVDSHEPAWEYEPRVWTPEETAGGGAGLSAVTGDADSDIWRDLAEPQAAESANPANAHRAPPQVRRPNIGESVDRRHFEDHSRPSRASLRNQTNFYDPRQGARLTRSSKLTATSTIMNVHDTNTTRQAHEEEAQKCDQFRVDIQETVICDRQRCEKLDFEWPKFDNQMVVVQTTRHGMRFYQAQLEFKPAQVQQVGRLPGRGVRPRVKLELANSSLPKMPPIKFDLMDLFKPKTTTTTTTSTTTLAPPLTSVLPDTPGPTGEPQEPPPSTAPPMPEPAPAPPAGPDPAADNRTELVTTFRLDTRRRMQRVLGFGGALSDSTCRNIKSLSPSMTKSLMEDYFGARGLGYTLVRMTMGSSDFSLTPYTNNDKPYDAASGESGSQRQQPRRRQAQEPTSVGESDDVEMKYFHLTEEDYDFKLPLARQALATSRRELKFFSSLWSPPVWMKNNSHIVHGYLKGDIYGPYYKALAELIVKWLEAYRRQGIEFWGTTGLNEPITGVRPFIFHNSLGITRDDFATWIKLYLGPMLRQRGFQHLKLMPVDDNKGYMPDWAASLLDDPETAKYIAGISLHWYMNDDYENLNFLVNKHPDKFLLSTEACNGYYPFQVHVLPGDWDRGMAYMLDITRLMHKNVVGWVDWNMVLTTSGGPSWPGNFIDAAVLVNADRDEYYKSPAYYALGHFSRFVVPDSYRLDHRLANARYDYPLEASGFYTPDEYVVIVVLNANRHRVPFKVIVDRQLVRVVDLRPESFNTIVFKWKRPG